jgi:hypothetical protein
MAEATPTPPAPPTLGATPPAAPAAAAGTIAVLSPPPAAVRSANRFHLRDGDGRLTRAGMEHAIRNKGSVLHNGAVHTTFDTLPTNADLAKGDPDMEDHARAELLQARAAIDAQLAKIGRAGKK